MLIFTRIADLVALLDTHRRQERSIGFVPTMGALHKGHTSLFKRCKAENEVTVGSIYVNPTQFNDPKDLTNYPRTMVADKQKLDGLCDILFLPDTNEMYPEPPTDTYNFGELETTMEGAKRPGHFTGVAQIVRRFFEAILPNRAYFGLKDFQQYLIIMELVKQLNLSIEVVGCETVREKNGLAMSSRNALLTPEMREKATVLYNTLEWVKMAPDATESEAMNKIKSAGLTPEYFVIDRPNNRAFVAARAGEVRLIDNMSIIS